MFDTLHFLPVRSLTSFFPPFLFFGAVRRGLRWPCFRKTLCRGNSHPSHPLVDISPLSTKILEGDGDPIHGQIERRMASSPRAIFWDGGNPHGTNDMTSIFPTRNRRGRRIATDIAIGLHNIYTYIYIYIYIYLLLYTVIVCIF